MPDEEQLHATRGYILLEATPSGQIEDSLQFCVRGEHPIRMQFPASKVTDIESLHQFTLTLEIRPEEIIFTENQPVSHWMDLGELVARETIIATKGEREANEQFSTLLNVRKTYTIIQ
jgi:hypothetical protein